MSFGDRLAATKPYVVGSILGAIVLAILAFSADWVVMTGEMEAKVERARVDAYASVCASRSIAEWAKNGGTLDDLDGWNNEQREELAQRFVPSVESADALQSEILESCEDMIEQA